MVVMWKEKPMLSSLSNMRVLSQFCATMRRGLFSHSSRVRTIIAFSSFVRCVIRMPVCTGSGTQVAREPGVQQAIMVEAKPCAVPPARQAMQGKALAGTGRRDGRESGCLARAVAIGKHFGKGFIQNVHGAVNLFFGNHQRAQTLDDLAVVAAGFYYQALVKGQLANAGGCLAVRAAHAQHHAATFHKQFVARVTTNNLLHAGADALAFFTHTQGKVFALPEVLKRGGGGDKGMVVAAESTVVLAWLPLVQFVFQQHYGKDRKSTRLNSSHVRISYAV